MMLRSRANEIPELIHDLGSRSRPRVDAARARLSIIGARAVEHLVEALEGEDDRIRGRIMPLLALIQDPRGRAPLVAMLLDRNWRLRGVAARCLARFSSPETVTALARVLSKERSEKVRVAAAQSLVEQYAAGEDQALCAVLQVLLEPTESIALRTAALPLLRALPPPHRRSIARRLSQDPVEAIRDAAREENAAIESVVEPDDTEIRELVGDLAVDDYAVWYAAVQRLGASGPDVVPRLIDEMRRRAHDPEYCARAGMALKALGPHRGSALADALDEIEEPLPLQVLIDVAGALGRKSLIYRLKDLIRRVGASSDDTAGANGFDPMQRVRSRAHLELARIGSRVAIEDLRGAVLDPERRLELELLAALSLIGKREEIPLLLRAYDREDRFVQQRIADVICTIMKRERIRRNDRMLLGLPESSKRALDAVLPRPAARRSRRRPTADPR